MSNVKVIILAFTVMGSIFVTSSLRRLFMPSYAIILGGAKMSCLKSVVLKILLDLHLAYIPLMWLI